MCVCVRVSLCHGSDFEDGIIFLNRHQYKLDDDLMIDLTLFKIFTILEKT